MFAWRALPPATAGASSGAYLTMPALQSAGIGVAFTTRVGGDSAAPFAGLNLSLVAGDERGAVLRNRARILGALGIEPAAWTSAQQIHAAAVARVEPSAAGSGATDPATTVPGADALWTDEPGPALAVLTADCLPIVLADPVERRVGVIHAGWRGAIAGVITAAVEAFKPRSTTVAGIGPAIGPCCYEVGEEVAEEARASLGDPVVRARPGRKPHLDLWRTATDGLAAAGVPAVWLSALCTRCEPHRFFSHRAGDAGRQGVIVAMRER